MAKALLVMDVQVSVMARYENTQALIQNINASIAAAEKADIPVFYVKVGFRAGFPEISGNNKMFGHLKSMQAAPPFNAMDLVPGLQAKPGAVEIIKRRVSAFTGSDLEVLLRAQQITHITLCGVATSGVVLSTLREAADKDYAITVLKDCCLDSEPEVHEVLVNKVFTKQATVVEHGEWVQGL